MEFNDEESCFQDFSDLGAEYKVLEVSVLMPEEMDDMARLLVIMSFQTVLIRA
jgi:hypothetical protein